ncbi:MAG: TIGR02147 family protein [Chitinispirillaceae bacterium]|nr:TIGR02147 family protein [Chitinispirillaceae bacterium]
MGRQNKPICVFDYFDYREYLSDVFAQLKKQRYGYSYRSFSREAGISSHNFLPRIIKRERNLSLEFLPKLCAYLKLSQKENRYFQTLVAFNNTKRPPAKEKLLKQLLTLRLVNEERRIEDNKLHFFDKWYYPVIRELACICDFQEDYALLARQCKPRISAAQAQGAVDYLVGNGFLRREADGRYQVIDQVIATEPEVDSTIISRYHKITITQCADAVDTVRKEERNFSSSTLLVSKELYDDIKKEILHFRKRLLAMARECNNPEMVCFAGFQLLPRSEIITSGTMASTDRGSR